MYEQLSASLSRPNHITFVKVNVDTQKEIASNYAVTAYVLHYQCYEDLESYRKIADFLSVCRHS